MKLIRSLTLLSLAVPMLLLSCSKDRDKAGTNTNDDRVEIVLKAGIGPDTRAYDGSWDENDAIGIAMLTEDGTAIINDVYNYHYFTAETWGQFSPAVDSRRVFFPQDGSAATFHGYYPYYPGLNDDMDLPVNVYNQTALKDIDLMTSIHLSGYTKYDKEVHLRFFHRLSKLIFRLYIDDGQEAVPLENFTLTIEGMNTEGQYDLLTETLTVNQDSGMDIMVPYRGSAAEREGIVLPRPAGSGVRFIFTDTNGGQYIANMDPDLELESMYKYIFNIDLRRTEATVSAEIIPWLDGPESDYELVQVSTPAGETFGVNEGDVMHVYYQNSGDFELLTDFTYMGNQEWTANPAVLWDDLPSQVRMRSSITAAAALNSTQIEDILISHEVTAYRYIGVNFELFHAGSKLLVTLTSPEFTQDELNSATLTLPNYLIGAYESNGEFIPGTQRGNITVDTETTPATAIIQPQTVPADQPVITVLLNGREYTAYAPAGGEVFAQSEAKHMHIRIDKTGMSVSAQVVDWTETEIDLDAITIGTQVSGAEGINAGEVLEVFRRTTEGRQALTEYTWSGTEWTTENPIFWEDLADPTTFYAQLLREAAPNTTQLDDYLVAAPRTIRASNGVDFQLSHAAAMVAVRLGSSDRSFSDEELGSMTVTLPDYANGGTYNNGIFTPGNGTGDIDVYQTSTTGYNGYAYIQPQSVAAGQNVAIVTFNGREYLATYDAPITYNAGVSTILDIDLNRTALTISARATDWVEGMTYALNATAITINGTVDNTSDFFQGKTIHFYRLGSNFQDITYSYLNTTSGWQWVGRTLYWEDMYPLPLNVTGIYYPYQDYIPTTLTAATTTFDWDLPTDQAAKGYANYDLMTSHLTFNQPDHVNFNFTHPLSMVRVVLTSDQILPANLRGSTVELVNVVTEGSISMQTGDAVSSGTPSVVKPLTETDGSLYSALVMPGNVNKGTPIVRVKLPGYTTPFTGTLNEPVRMQPGLITVITVNVKLTEIELSATLEEWETGDEGSVTIE